MKYIKNLELMEKELTNSIKENKIEDFYFVIDHKIFYVVGTKYNYILLLHLVKEEIDQVRCLSFTDEHNYEIKKSTYNIDNSIDYSHNLKEMYKSFLLLNKKVDKTIVEFNLEYCFAFNLKVIINNNIYEIEMSADMVDIFKKFYYELCEDYLTHEDVIKIEESMK